VVNALADGKATHPPPNEPYTAPTLVPIGGADVRSCLNVKCAAGDVLYCEEKCIAINYVGASLQISQAKIC
jgi:hypothetical protein